MKKILVMMVAALVCCATAMAGDMKQLVVKTTPEVLTAEALTKVKNKLRLTAGVKKVEADPSARQVMVTYDTAKTNSKKILAALKKGGYEATVVSDGAPSEKKPQVDATSGATKQQHTDATSGASKQKK